MAILTMKRLDRLARKETKKLKYRNHETQKALEKNYKTTILACHSVSIGYTSFQQNVGKYVNTTSI